MTGFHLDNATARRVFLDRHALAEPPTGPAGPDEIQSLIERLGFVQVDSVQTVARAHHMILWSRRQRYRPATLTRLLEGERSLFENWTHDAAIIPTRFFPYWHAKFQRSRMQMETRWPKWQGDAFLSECENVLSRIASAGALSAGEAGNGKAGSGGGWWEWQPAKAALEFLWRSGDLAIARREGFRKFYDLTENVIAEAHRGPAPSAHTLDWACNAALERLGFATHGEIAAFWDIFSPAEARDWCHAETAAGRLIEGQIEAADGRAYRAYARPEMTEAAGLVAEPPPGRIRILSPFDPALRDRKRTERLFGFHYRIEIFVPEPKRKYGYYVFPVMEGARLIGRLDARALRDSDCLSVRAFWPEPGLRMGKARLDRLEAELDRLARFSGCGRVDLADGWLREPLPG